jgi:hypothetical protein
MKAKDPQTVGSEGTLPGDACMGAYLTVEATACVGVRQIAREAVQSHQVEMVGWQFLISSGTEAQAVNKSSLKTEDEKR